MRLLELENHKKVDVEVRKVGHENWLLNIAKRLCAYTRRTLAVLLAQYFSSTVTVIESISMCAVNFIRGALSSASH